MKKILIEGEEYYYNIYNSTDGYFHYTDFYKKEGKRPKWEFLRWKSKKLVDNFIKIFRVYRDIECKLYTKQDINYYIEKELRLLKREEEIKKGEII